MKLLPIKKVNEKDKVIIKWLVTVILYGNIPKRLLKKIHKNKLYNIIINEYFFIPAASFKIPDTYINSRLKNFCILFNLKTELKTPKPSNCKPKIENNIIDGRLIPDP